MDSTLYVYCSSDRVFSEADDEDPDPLTKIRASDSRDYYIGGPAQFSKFVKLFQSQIDGRIFTFDAIEEKYFFNETLHKITDEQKDFFGEVISPVYLQVLSHLPDGYVMSQTISFCPPAYFYEFSNTQTICYRKVKLEFGLGLKLDENKNTRLSCSDLYPRPSSLAETNDESEMVKNSAYFGRCFDPNFTLKFSLENDGLVLGEKGKTSKVEDASKNMSYRDFSCSDKTKNCFWFRNPEQGYCRKIKECQICSLANQCVYQTEISMCVSINEVEDLDQYAFLKIWKKKFTKKNTGNTLHTLDLASLKIYKTCPSSHDLINVLESDNQKILTGAKFRFQRQTELQQKYETKISRGSSYTLNYESYSGIAVTSNKPNLATGVMSDEEKKLFLEKKEEYQTTKITKSNAKSYSMKLFFSKEMFEEFKPSYQLPILIVRLQGVIDHLYDPKMSQIYVFDFGKVQKMHSGHGILNFVASEFSISLIFPESYKQDRQATNLPDYFQHVESSDQAISLKSDFVIEYSVTETYEMFFMALIYFVIVSIFLLFMGFVCLSTAALCARRLDNRGVNHPLNVRIARILERIRARNVELRNIIMN